eukprot:TRINITY_DN5211_c0_g1_i2.p1 TRINITY_DN5211_c0_g1~~TRINITY_DN5211_c0_g1_i2.p1  ORF type:complete len:932 (+),score=185.05 TRINITY_DN5211_c0_g1_i2:145-2940(+)
MALAGGAMTVAAAGMAPKVATKVFGYNRENFMEDREQRMKKEFKEREFRIVQSKLWREDVRDFVSLTEQKMSLYLIINVLLLSFTVTLWVEGQLPETTPDWLVMGYQIACVVAFSFLLLTIWLAMHAAVAAQSYQTRILTQLVRLPIPTWKELEACRTAASEFEKIESRQMFRVPFVTGSQESFVPGHTANETGDLASTDVMRERSGNTSAHEETVKEDVAADPWGLEQRGDNVYELGTHSASETASLRHVKLMRQAAVYWQTYDAFARVSMSVGINQLMLGMSYFILGYAMLEVKAPCAAIGGVFAFMGSAEVITRVDLTLPVMQQRLVQLLVAIGPMMSCVASYLWSFHRESQAEFSEMLAPLAYISNGFAIGIMTIFVQVEEQENGAMVPNAFRSVLFLDVFGWVSQKKEQEIPPPTTTEEAQVITSPMGRIPEVSRRTAKPAASAVNYDKFGNSLPATARDTGPAGSLEDLRYLPGAPRSWETVNAIEPPAKDFWDPVTFMPHENRERSMFDDLISDDHRDQEAEEINSFGLGLPASPIFNYQGKETPIVTGHDNEAPGAAPWRIFRNLALVTCLFWLCAGIWCFMKATVPQLVEMGLAFEDTLEEEHTHPPQMGAEEGPKPVVAPKQHTKGTRRASLFEVRRTVLKAGRSEHIAVRWPYPGIVPKGLSCDIHGRHLLVTDGLSIYLADVASIDQAESQAKMQASILADFQQGATCPSLLGERLQDTALACADTSLSSCEALILHRRGSRLASCKLTAAAAGSQAFDVSSSWLSRPGALDTSKLEQTNFLMLDPACVSSGDADTLSPGCTSVGTSLGRSARLQLASRGSGLIPLDVTEGTDSGEDSWHGQEPDSMRSLTERYLGVLNATDKSIEIQDLEQGGARLAKLALGGKVSVQAFCASRDHVYLIGGGVQPEMWRIPFPTSLK